MRKIFVLFLMTMCGLTTAFGQLRVNNDFGQDLNVTIGGQKNLVPYKGTKTFRASGRTVWLECVTLDGRLKFNFTKNVSRNGLVRIEATDNVLVNSSTSTVTSVTSVQNSDFSSNSIPLSNASNSNITQSSGGLTAILKNNSQSNTQPSTTRQSVTSTYVQPTVTKNESIQLPQKPQNQIVYKTIRVVYTGSQMCKVFSDIGGGSWKGLEFYPEKSDDPAKGSSSNSYKLPVQVDRDLHIGLVFNLNNSINEYGEFRRRINKNDSVLYIGDNEIKKMSSYGDEGAADKKFKIKPRKMRVELLAKGYKIVFGEPNNEVNKISLKSGDKSPLISVPNGQFYIQVSCTRLADMMYCPTFFIPIHTTFGDRMIQIKTADIERVLGGYDKDLNLFWVGF